MPTQDLFEKGLLFFNSGRYFEAHEVWEDLWRITQGPLKTFYQGLIQAAVALHHLQRRNQTGARGQITKSIDHLISFQDNPHFVDTVNLIEQLQAIQAEMQFRSVSIARIK